MKNHLPTTNPIGILGGTFDPIHLGHIHIALKVLEQVPLTEIKFIPSGKPVHRHNPAAPATLRAQMIALALKNYPKLHLDLQEIDRGGPSYMIETLISLRRDYPNTPLCLIMGMDAYLYIDTWKDWEELLNYAHFIVVNRPQSADQKISATPLYQHVTESISDLTHYLSGRIIFLNVEPCSISATLIRNKIKSHEDVSSYLPLSVYDFIKRHHLYL